MVRSPGFGSNSKHYVALFRLAFTVAPSIDLTLHLKLTRWIVLQKARRHRINRLRHFVGTQFQALFHSLPRVLFTFPSLYLFTIDRISYLVLAGGPARFRQGFSCPVLLEIICNKVLVLSLTRLSRSLVSHSNYSASNQDFLPYITGDSPWLQISWFDSKVESTDLKTKFSQPLISIRLSAYSSELTDENLKGLDYFRFARHYSENRYLLFIPRPTKMFQFSQFPLNYTIYSGNGDMT